MNITDRAEMTEGVERCMTTGYKECPYCEEEMVRGTCKDCGWNLSREYPPMEDE